MGFSQTHSLWFHRVFNRLVERFFPVTMVQRSVRSTLSCHGWPWRAQLPCTRLERQKQRNNHHCRAKQGTMRVLPSLRSSCLQGRRTDTSCPSIETHIHHDPFAFLISELARSLSSSWQYTVHLLSAPRYRSAQSSSCSTDQLRSSATRSAASRLRLVRPHAGTPPAACGQPP
jgi:hypothetical protein